MAAKEAEKDDRNFDEIYKKWPDGLKGRISYTPDDLRRNQEITVLGIKISIASTIGYLVSAIIASIASYKYAALLPPLLRIPLLVAIPALLAAFFSKVSTLVSSSVNNWNDVQHWGPLLLQQAQDDLNKGGPGSGSGSGSFVARSYTNVRTQTTAKPKLFTGTFFSGQLAKRGEYVRKVDDQIESIADMVDDLEINLVEWLKRVPGYLNYELAVVNNPKDEHGVPKTGTWVVCNLYLTNSVHKRLLVENILLGPVDPSVYYPEYNSIQAINISVPEILKAEEIKAMQLPSGHEFTIDANGNVVAGFFGGWDSKRVVSPPVAGSAPASPSASAPSVSGAGAGPTVVGVDRKVVEESDAVSVPLERGARSLPRVVRVVASSLNIRPSADTGGYYPGGPKYSKGQLLEIFREVEGENVGGIDTWYNVRSTSRVEYIWAGGVEELDAKEPAKAVAEAPTPALLGVPFSLPKTTPPTQAGASFASLNQPTPAFKSLEPAQPLRIFNPEAQPKPKEQGMSFPRQVTVILDSLNVRAEPTTAAPLAGSQKLAKGDVFTAVALVTGKVVDGNDKWWLSSKGNYVWSGGTSS